MKKYFTALSMGLFFAAQAYATEIVPIESQKDLEVTIYNGDLALISETRPITLKMGVNPLDIRGLAMQMRPETILFSNLEVDALRFLNNQPSLERLYNYYLGKEVTYIEKDPTNGQEKEQKAKIIALANGAPILQIGNRIETEAPGRIVLPSWPEAFQTEPSLLLSVNARQAGSIDAKWHYLTRGLSWAADYVAILSEDEKSIDLTGYASIQNNSGTSFKKAKLRLVSGQVTSEAVPYARAQDGVLAAVSAPKLVQDPSLSDYHLYTMPEPVDLNEAELKQLALIKTTKIAVEKEYHFDDLAGSLRGIDGGVSDDVLYHAAISIAFNNRTENHLGVPLPAGTVRVYSDLQGGSIFLGENAMADIPVGEKVMLFPGKAFDVTAKVAQGIIKQKSENEREVSVTMELSNQRDLPALIVITEQIFGEWQITEENEKHSSEAPNKPSWRIVIPAKTNKKLIYKINVKTP